MELANYKACICEGSAENAIMDILLDYNLFLLSTNSSIVTSPTMYIPLLALLKSHDVFFIAATSTIGSAK